jgi:hypothetical protein
MDAQADRTISTLEKLQRTEITVENVEKLNQYEMVSKVNMNLGMMESSGIETIDTYLNAFVKNGGVKQLVEVMKLPWKVL